MRSYSLLVLLMGVALAAGELASQGADKKMYDYFEYFDDEMNAPRRCGYHERYSRCSANPVCQRTCDNISQPGIPCPRTRVCINGCVCIDGYVRSEVNGPCVIENSCPRVKH